MEVQEDKKGDIGKSVGNIGEDGDDSEGQRLYRRDRCPKSNQSTKRAADNWPFLRTSKTVC